MTEKAEKQLSTLEWLKSIKDEEIREKAIANYNNDPSNLMDCNKFPAGGNSLFDAIVWAFPFTKTEEGLSYWSDVCKKAEGGEL